MVDTINLKEKFNLFSEHWSPKIVGELNDSYIKLAKVQGEFLWHYHENEDELFFVFKGTLTVKLREKDLVIHEGEFAVIPRGVEHMPVADDESFILLLEPKSTLNTGNITGRKTVNVEWI